MDETGRADEKVRQPGRIARRGLMLVLSSPSGAGKSTMARRLLADEPELSFSVSATTRPPRPGETNGVDYDFRDDIGFDALVADGALLEWAEVYGRRYGTPRAPVERALAEGRDVLFDIDWQGARQLRAAARSDVVSVYLLPPSYEAQAQRLRARGQDDDSVIERRLAAICADLAHAPDYDYVIVNDDLERCYAAVRGALWAERARKARLTGLDAFIEGFVKP